MYPHVWRPDPGGDADPLPAGNLERFSSTLYDIITMAMSTLCFGLFMAAFVLTLIIQIQRFSKNLLGTRDT